jgi:hypothetical protein
VATGAMTGADAPALRALAAQMSQSAGRLDGIRQGIRSRLYSVHWDGPDGVNFRRMWDGQHVPLLAAVAEGLRAASQELLAQAQQQELASGSGPGGATMGPGGVTMGPSTGGVRTPGDDGFLDYLEGLAKGAGLALGASATFFTRLAEGYGRQVSGHWRNGTWIDSYTRWAAGHATTLNRWFGSHSDVLRHADEIGRVGKFVPYVGGAFAGIGQWEEDAGYDTGERTARAIGGGGAAVLADVGVEWGATAAGAAIGTAIFPGVGTVVGGLIGWGAAAWTTNHFEDQITDIGADFASAVYDIGGDVVDFGGDALEAGGELLGDVGEGAADLWEDLTPW